MDLNEIVSGQSVVWNLLVALLLGASRVFAPSRWSVFTVACLRYWLLIILRCCLALRYWRWWY